MSTRVARGLAREAGDSHEERGGKKKSRSYRLKDKEAPSEGIRRIAHGRAQKAAEELNDAGNADDFASPVHAVRKDLKKLRAVLRLVRDELGDDLYRSENRRYREAGRLLSQTRDAEVKAETLNGLREQFDGKLSSDLVDAWLAALERNRQEIAEKVSNGADSLLAESLAAIEAGQEKIPSWPLNNDSWELFEAGLLRSYRRGRRAMKRTRSDPRAENVHEWRKRTKDLWYQLQILRNAWPPLISETADQAHELADLLGDHHDLGVLGEDLASRKIDGDRDAVEGLIARRQDELLESAFEIGARLLAEKPKAFRRRFASYWLAWRPR